MSGPMTMDYVRAMFAKVAALPPRDLELSVHPPHLRDHATALWLWLASESQN